MRLIELDEAIRIVMDSAADSFTRHAISEKMRDTARRDWVKVEDRLPEDGQKVWTHSGRKDTAAGKAFFSTDPRILGQFGMLHKGQGFFIRDMDTLMVWANVSRWAIRLTDTPPPNPEEG